MKKKFLKIFLLFVAGAYLITPLYANEFDSVKGQWLRPDGGYVLIINDIDKEGNLDSVYLNPRPINVSQANVTTKDDQIKIFVELRDTYYPGSYYTLTYDPDNDRLVGVYHHLGINQDFDVYFVRK